MDSPIFEKKNVLVTGGAGFIGSHLCEKLLREANVICLDDFSNSSPENINHLLQYPDFEFINVDVNQPIDLTAYAELDKFKIKFQGIQELYHLACPTSPADFEKLKMKSLLANSAAMINTLDVAVKYRAKYVFASSSVVYGSATPEKFTFKEEDQGIVDHLSPRACYDEGKRFGETCVATYNQVHGLDAKIARIFTTYGPHMKLFEGQPIIDLIVNALENKDVIVPGGDQHLTTLCYVSDMVDGLLALMATDSSVKVVNIGGDKIIKTMDVAKQIIAMTESKSQIVPGEELSFVTHPGVPDLYRVKNSLGWFPLVTLDQGLTKTIEYAVANKQALLYTHFDKLGR